MASLIVVAMWAMTSVYSIYPTKLGMNNFLVRKSTQLARESPVMFLALVSFIEPIPAIAEDAIGARRDPHPPEMMRVLMLCMSLVSLRPSINSTRGEGRVLRLCYLFRHLRRSSEDVSDAQYFLFMWSGQFHSTLVLVCLSPPLSFPLSLVCG